MSRTPSVRSSAARVRTTDGSEVPSASAAAVRLPRSTMRTKAVIACSLSMRKHYSEKWSNQSHPAVFIATASAAIICLTAAAGRNAR